MTTSRREHDATMRSTTACCLRCGAYTDEGSAWCLGCRGEALPSPYRRVHLSKEEADHEFHVDILDDPSKATQCRLIVAGYTYCSIPRDQHPDANPPVSTSAAPASAAREAGGANDEKSGRRR